MQRNASFSPVVFAISLCAACALDAPNAAPLAEHAETLTEAQCEYFASLGKVQICHRTDSARKPYTILRVDEQACIHAHAGHTGDYVAVDDPTCQGQGCLPESAPCETTLGCCDGLTCEAGVCVSACSPTTCSAAGASCGSIPDGCGGTLECGPPCPTCPCATQGGWGSGPISYCLTEPENGVLAALIAGEVGVSGGVWGVAIPEGVPSCVVQFPHGAFSQYTAVSMEEYDVCKAEVEAALEAAQISTSSCAPLHPCYPRQCEDDPSLCGIVDDGCGGELNCGTCSP